MLKTNVKEGIPLAVPSGGLNPLIFILIAVIVFIMLLLIVIASYRGIKNGKLSNGAAVVLSFFAIILVMVLFIFVMGMIKTLSY